MFGGGKAGVGLGGRSTWLLCDGTFWRCSLRGYDRRSHDEGLMAVLRPGSWTLVAKENGDAKTGMLGSIGFQASAEFCDILLLLHTPSPLT